MHKGSLHVTCLANKKKLEKKTSKFKQYRVQIEVVFKNGSVTQKSIESSILTPWSNNEWNLYMMGLTLHLLIL